MAKTVKPVRMRLLRESSEPLNMMATPEINAYLKTIKQAGGDRPLSREEEREYLNKCFEKGRKIFYRNLNKLSHIIR